MKNIIVIMLLAFAGSGAQAQTPQTGSKHWKLVWQDEFNYTGLPDPAKWGYETGHVRNNEEQYYTLARKENAWVGNGMLTITGRKEEYVNKDYQRGAASWKRKDSLAHYTSASINTLGKAGWKYGKIVIRAKIPHGAGMWPALWMLGVNTPQAGWPAGGKKLPAGMRKNRRMTELQRSGVDRVFQPVERAAVDRHDVEAAWRRFAVTLQVALRSDDQARLLGGSHAGSRAAETAIGTFPHFHENQHAAILHHQVDFSALAAEIGGDEFQPLPFEMLLRAPLAGIARKLFGGTRAGQPSEQAHRAPPGSGTGLPPR